MNKTPRFSDDSSERLWLAIAFISSTESCVIGYNAMLYKRLCLWLSASQRSKCRFKFSSWCCQRYNHTGVVVSNIYKKIFGYFLSFGSCIQNPLRSEIWGGTCPKILESAFLIGACLHTHRSIITVSVTQWRSQNFIFGRAWAKVRGH